MSVDEVGGQALSKSSGDAEASAAAHRDGESSRVDRRPGTSVIAEAVRTLDWLADEAVSFVVPVYQRQYRWSTDACARLLADLRAVSAAGDARTHFFGSILTTETHRDGIRERMLVDGQQRVTTLTLLIAALRRALGPHDGGVGVMCDRVLLHPFRAEDTKLSLRKQAASDLADVVLRGAAPEEAEEVSHVWGNFEYFLEAVREDAAEIWRGIQRLEHVAVTLTEQANPQQVFESLNSTGVQLRNHELVHNYVLMGLDHEQQVQIEDAYWAPIEENTGDAIDGFLRDYLILRTGRDSDLSGDRGLYDVFCTQFPWPKFESLVADAEEWRALSEIYRVLLDPSRQADPKIERQLRYVNAFGASMYPLLLGVYRDFLTGRIEHSALLELLEQLQSLYLRLMVVGSSREHLRAQLCRRLNSYEQLTAEISRRTPWDERVARALAFQPLPHAGYVLARIDDVTECDELQVEHIFPQQPTDAWSPDGIRYWHEFDDLERARYREVLSTIGNLTLLEQSLNAAASNKAFALKREYFARSRIASTRTLATASVWNIGAITERTKQMTARFLEIWKRSSIESDDAVELVPILDVQKRPDYYPGWKTEFEYVRFQGEIWEIQNVRRLFQRVFLRLWSIDPTKVLAFNAAHKGPVIQRKEQGARLVALSDSYYLYMGEYPQYQLAHVQAVAEYFDLADDLLVKLTPREA